MRRGDACPYIVGCRDDWNYDAGHLLGRVVLERGAEAMLVASATRLGDNLIVFTTNLRPGARVDIIRFQPLTHLRRQTP
jgi:hypothetical protein